MRKMMIEITLKQFGWQVFFVLIFRLHIKLKWIPIEMTMNEWTMHIALYCVSLYTQSALIMCGGGVSSNHHQCTASTSMMRRLPQNNSTSALTTPATGGERVIEPIKCMHSPQTSYRWRDSHRANQVDALTTHQLQVERRDSHRASQVYALTTHQLQVER